MLNHITRKLCPLMTLALAFGCGKKIGEPQTSTDGRSNQPQEESSSLTLQIDTSVSKRTVYPITRNADFRGLPSKLVVRQGNATGALVKVYYNVDDELADENIENYAFVCTYKSTNTASEIPLQKCTSLTGGDYGDVTNPDYPNFMDRGKYIQMELKSTHSDNLIIQARYTVDWIQRN